MEEQCTGKKYDDGKLQYHLLPFEEVADIVRVLEFGAKKYSPAGWVKVVTAKDGKQRYFSACMRHLIAWFCGEKYDKESGCSHLAHAGCCILFLLFADKTANEKHYGNGNRNSE